MGQNEANRVAAVAELIDGGLVRADERPLQKAPTADEIDALLAPLLEWCDASRPATGRGVVGIVAPAGAGKTHVLGWLKAVAQVLDLRGFAFVSMDGYHLPNAVLESRAGRTIDGQLVPLRQLKGVPSSYAGDALLADLRQLKTFRNNEWLPVYSRESHEPRAGALRVGPEVEWVFIEGNFLYLPDGPWAQMCELFDRRVFIDVDEATVRRQLVDRHARSGRDPAKFDEHYRNVDQPNNRLIRASRTKADVLWARSPDGRLIQSNRERKIVHECR